ncbi:BLOC-1-related complex subunit 6 isoform X2 [Brachyhypopomus gauderio]|uniref:BLOC-1-related complex subunit 6 isoform X2 n=1 Tax=Brachyhypopomus gauderio TaxID=698409 RepID=UPI004042F661
MSHSSGIGQDVEETTNGVDASNSPDACDWAAAYGSTSQEFKCPDGLDQQEETLSDVHTCAALSTDSVCRQTRTRSALHGDEGHAQAEGSSHTHTPCSRSVDKARLPMDTVGPAHKQTSDGWGKVDEMEIKKWKEEVKKAEDSQNTADVPVQPVKRETTIEDEPTSISPSMESPNPTSSYQDDAPSAFTPPDQAPPLVPPPPPESAPPPMLPDPEDWPRPTHVMAEVRVRAAPEWDRERVVRGMQDSKSLDGLSEACGGGSRGAGPRGGQPEGRRATISSALELEGTVSRDGDLTHFITKNLEQKIKMSSRPSLDTDSDCSGPVVRGRGSLRRPADIPPIDPSVVLDLHKHTQEVAHSVETMLRSLSGTIQNMTALSVGYIQTYRDSVDSLGESVDMSIKMCVWTCTGNVHTDGTV